MCALQPRFDQIMTWTHLQNVQYFLLAAYWWYTRPIASMFTSNFVWNDTDRTISRPVALCCLLTFPRVDFHANNPSAPNPPTWPSRNRWWPTYSSPHLEENPHVRQVYVIQSNARGKRSIH